MLAFTTGTKVWCPWGLLQSVHESRHYIGNCEYAADTIMVFVTHRLHFMPGIWTVLQ